MALSGPGVQSVGNRITIGLSDGTHRCSFRNVLADQTVEVLVAPALPRMIGRGKVALQREMMLKHLVVMKLCAVVEGNSFEVGPMLCDCIQCGEGHGGSGS